MPIKAIIRPRLAFLKKSVFHFTFSSQPKQLRSSHLAECRYDHSHRALQGDFFISPAKFGLLFRCTVLSFQSIVGELWGMLSQQENSQQLKAGEPM